MKVFLAYIKKLIPKKLFKKLQPYYHYGLSFIAAHLYGRPSNKLIVIGITGTSGKTSSTYLMARALSDAGYKTGYTSTAMFSDGDKEWLNDKKMTMLGPFFTQKMLRKMVKNGCSYAIVETTSEGIRQFRHRFINYDFLVFTGLYPEHIESHGSFENYKKAKGALFAHLKRCLPKYLNSNGEVVKEKNKLAKIDLDRVKKTFIINSDDEHASYFSSFWAEEKVFYSGNLRDDLDAKVFFFDQIQMDISGTSFDFIYKEKEELFRRRINLKLWGEFNVVNSMPFLVLIHELGLEPDTLIQALEKIKNIPGRMEMIDVGQKFLAIVDYAYEPVAMKKMYEIVYFLKDQVRESGYDPKIIHVLGSAGGGRDKDRREVMGRMAAEKSDFVVVTNEDPYDENPLEIINQVATGARELGKIEGQNLFRILDRREAIKKALQLTGEGDIIVLSGKGCEQAICLANNYKAAWDDRLVLKEEIIKLT